MGDFVRISAGDDFPGNQVRESSPDSIRPLRNRREHRGSRGHILRSRRPPHNLPRSPPTGFDNRSSRHRPLPWRARQVVMLPSSGGTSTRGPRCRRHSPRVRLATAAALIHAAGLRFFAAWFLLLTAALLRTATTTFARTDIRCRGIHRLRRGKHQTQCQCGTRNVLCQHDEISRMKVEWNRRFRGRRSDPVGTARKLVHDRRQSDDFVSNGGWSTGGASGIRFPSPTPIRSRDKI